MHHMGLLSPGKFTALFTGMLESSQEEYGQLHHFMVLLSLNFVSSDQTVMCPPSFETIYGAQLMDQD
jgi:hypothetical protein